MAKLRHCLFLLASQGQHIVLQPRLRIYRAESHVARLEMFRLFKPEATMDSFRGTISLLTRLTNKWSYLTKELIRTTCKLSLADCSKSYLLIQFLWRLSVANDLQISQEPLNQTLFSKVPKGVTVHEGFQKTFERTADEVMAGIQQGLKDNGFKKVMVVGHRRAFVISYYDELN